MTKDEALKLALVIEEFDKNDESLPLELLKVIAATLRALAQPEQEPWPDLTKREPLTDEKIKTLYAALKDVERTKGFSSENWFQAGLVMGEALHDIKENT